MPYRAWNKSSAETKRRFFALTRQGMSGQAASLTVGVSPSCGSLWFIDAGRVDFLDPPISGRYLTQDDRIEIADGLVAGEAVKSIAVRIGKSHQTVYREIARNRKSSRSTCRPCAPAGPTDTSGAGAARATARSSSRRP